MSLLDQDKIAEGVRESLTLWLADFTPTELCQKAFAGACYTWLENHDQLVEQALAKAVAAFMEENACAIANGIAYHVARLVKESEEEPDSIND